MTCVMSAVHTKMAVYKDRLRVVFLLFCWSTASYAEKRTYKGYMIYEVTPSNEKQSDFLYSLLESDMIHDFLHLPRRELNTSSRAVVGPEHHCDFQKSLNKNKIKFKIINNNFSKTIKGEQVPTPRNIFSKDISFKRYLRFSEIDSYLDDLAKRFPWRVEVQSVGKSFEGRAIKSVTITNGIPSTGKQIILIEAGIHAREWLAPATALYIIHQLVEKFIDNIAHLTNFDWVIMPLVNPDGYEFSHQNDRLWRKTRKPNKIPQCPGTDGNRNFDNHWGEYGSSTNECKQFYCGSRPFSEPETQAVRSVMSAVKKSCKMYLSLHSYGSFIFYPWGWTLDRPNNWKDMHEVAQAGADAIESSMGRSYKIGNSAKLLYKASGGSADYAFSKEGIPIALTMELPYAGTGFDPIPREIRRLAKETWVGIKAMAKKLECKYRLSKLPDYYCKKEA